LGREREKPGSMEEKKYDNLGSEKKTLLLDRRKKKEARKKRKKMLQRAIFVSSVRAAHLSKVSGEKGGKGRIHSISKKTESILAEGGEDARRDRE